MDNFCTFTSVGLVCPSLLKYHGFHHSVVATCLPSPVHTMDTCVHHGFHHSVVMLLSYHSITWLLSYHSVVATCLPSPVHTMRNLCTSWLSSLCRGYMFTITCAHHRELVYFYHCWVSLSQPSQISWLSLQCRGYMSIVTCARRGELHRFLPLSVILP